MLEDIIKPIVEARGLTLWSCETQGQGRQTILRVMVDGITLDDCAKLSREISAILDVEDPFRTPYHLEVSSPGIDRKLSTIDHFTRYIGENIKVKWRTENGDYKHGVATIEKVEGDNIFLKTESKTVMVSIDDIVKSQVLSASQPER